jgi:hypothetical protein
MDRKNKNSFFNIFTVGGIISQNYNYYFGLFFVVFPNHIKNYLQCVNSAKLYLKIGSNKWNLIQNKGQAQLFPQKAKKATFGHIQAEAKAATKNKL